jgi:uracil-DNA glycosylase family 4
MSQARERLVRARLLGERFVVRLPGSIVESPTAVEPSTVMEEAAEEVESLASWFDQEAWESVRAQAMECRKCDLCQGRTTVVWGSGTPHTALLVVGEAPGYHEDQRGEAFVGPAGQLLTKILEAIGFRRDQVFITNVLKCRPPGNADPHPHQVAACEPYLVSQIELIRPAAILALGRHAAHTLLRSEAPMASLRGRVFRYQGVPLIATYHPAALLRNAKLKRPTWEDVQLLRRIYDDEMAARSAEGAA